MDLPNRAPRQWIAFSNFRIDTEGCTLVVFQHRGQFVWVFVSRALVNEVSGDAADHQSFRNAPIQCVEAFDDPSFDRPTAYEPVQEGRVHVRIERFTLQLDVEPPSTQGIDFGEVVVEFPR